MLVVCSAHYHARACLLAHTRSLNAHDGGEQHKLESLVLQKTVMKKKNTQADATQTMAHPHTVFVCVCECRGSALWLLVATVAVRRRRRRRRRLPIHAASFVFAFCFCHRRALHFYFRCKTFAGHLCEGAPLSVAALSHLLAGRQAGSHPYSVAPSLIHKLPMSGDKVAVAAAAAAATTLVFVCISFVVVIVALPSPPSSPLFLHMFLEFRMAPALVSLCLHFMYKTFFAHFYFLSRCCFVLLYLPLYS